VPENGVLKLPCQYERVIEIARASSKPLRVINVTAQKFILMKKLPLFSCTSFFT
jgi:hypothetical protein